jgi:hypothetical protein
MAPFPVHAGHPSRKPPSPRKPEKGLFGGLVALRPMGRPCGVEVVAPVEREAIDAKKGRWMGLGKGAAIEKLTIDCQRCRRYHGGGHEAFQSSRAMVGRRGDIESCPICH